MGNGPIYFAVGVGKGRSVETLQPGILPGRRFPEKASGRGSEVVGQSAGDALEREQLGREGRLRAKFDE